jgi:hypothetical protein
VNYTVEMASGGMTYIPSFIKIGSGVQTLGRDACTDTHRQQDHLISLLLFFQNKESRLKMGHLQKRLRITVN